MAIVSTGSPPPPRDIYGTSYVKGDDSNFGSTIGAWTAIGGATLARDTSTTYRIFYPNASAPAASLKVTVTAQDTGAQLASIPAPPGGWKTGHEYQCLIALEIEENAVVERVRVFFGVDHTGTNSAFVPIGPTAGGMFDHGPQLITPRWKPSANSNAAAQVYVNLSDGAAPAGGTQTWHIELVLAQEVLPNSAGLRLFTDTTPGQLQSLYLANSGFVGVYLMSRPSTLSDPFPPNLLFVDKALSMSAEGSGLGLGLFGGYIYADDNAHTTGRRAIAGGHLNVEVGTDAIGLAIAERSSTELEVYPDYSDYDLFLMDGHADADTKHWWHEEADGAYKASAGRKSRIGLYFQTAFHVTGVQTTGTAKNEPGEYWQLPYPAEIDEVRIHAGTAPTGATLIVDVNINGTTIFTTQANRPAIAISGTDATSGAPDTTAFAKNDRLSFDTDQVGSIIPGSDLTVMVRGRYLW